VACATSLAGSVAVISTLLVERPDRRWI
jgi:hypothetical protein